MLNWNLCTLYWRTYLKNLLGTVSSEELLPPLLPLDSLLSLWQKVVLLYGGSIVLTLYSKQTRNKHPPYL